MRNVAVIGCGHWGKNLVRNFAALGALRTVCDTEQTKLVGLKDQYPDVRATTSYRDLLSDPDVQAVVIVTPAAAHCAHAQEALETGKDVFVENPGLLTRVSRSRRLYELLTGAPKGTVGYRAQVASIIASKANVCRTAVPGPKFCPSSPRARPGAQSPMWWRT